MMPARITQRGLTLIELLVAMAVFTVVATIGYAGLQQTIAAKRQLTSHSDQLTELQRSMLRLERDLTSLAPRPARDHLGDSQPAFYSRGTGNATRVEFTHSGRHNSAELPQSNLQRVHYYWSEEGIVRLYWHRLDAIAGTQPRTQLLFPEASALTWSFLDRRYRWHDQWPPLNQTTNTDHLLPRAVRVSLQTPTYGDIQRTFITGAGG
ncbi:MAG: type II secretion system minor pseudopilin GspJ [Immundisolibacteraceae bacterium]|nr:type II secretion system minor pseudopilin GspJ [Immundisolibacteraceae bacterium]